MLSRFLRLSRQEISKIVKNELKPRCVVIMLNGTRRMLKLNPKYRKDQWLYEKSHIRKLIYKSIATVDMLFDMGIDTVIGPLASFGNLHRDKFIPDGLQRLMDPLVEEYPMGVYKKHSCSVTFYGDINYTKSLNQGTFIEKYLEKFRTENPKKPKKHLLIGLGFSTDGETEIVANIAINYYLKYKKKPTIGELIYEYFGYNAPSVDIFIRSNEIRTSGGLTPLLTGHDTQLYFPVSPGIVSFSERVIRSILYDYLFCRNKSHGVFEHREITEKEVNKIKYFYHKSKNIVFGLGERIGDIWIPKLK